MGGKIKREIAIVEGRELNQYMTDNLLQAAEKAGFVSKQIKNFNEYLITTNLLDKVFPDMVLWRSPVDFSSNVMIERVLLWVNKNRKITLNTHSIGGRSYNSNKYFQHELFYNEPYVREHVLKSFPANNKKFIKEKLISGKLINYPFVLKPCYGTRGEGIVLIHDESELDAFEKENLLGYFIEEYIVSKYDWRVFVLGGVALGVMRKIGNESDPGDFIAKSGGILRDNEPDKDLYEELCKLAVHATAACGIEYAGVDIIRDDNTGRLVVLETNICGGWQNGFLGATGVDVPEKIMEWFEDKAVLLEQKTSVGVQQYVDHRINLLSRAAQKKYWEIMNFEHKNYQPRDVLSFRLESPETSLLDKLKCAYELIQDERHSDSDMVRIKTLLNTIEKYEISSFGGFVGKDSGSLEDSIEETAYYLAISSKTW